MQLREAMIAILFYKGEPVSFAELASTCSSNTDDIKIALSELNPILSSLGLTVVVTDDSAELRTSKDSSALIDSIRKEEMSRDLGKAGLETLSILMYKGPSTRAEIDYVRGVNSTAILRNLLIRGLIEKIPNPADQRSFVYKPTHDLLAHLGIERVEDMTEYATIRTELDSFDNAEKVAAS